jgi:hypothetical protein
MVRTGEVFLVMLAACHAVTAAPSKEIVTSSFSFLDWVDRIIADPNGEHLSPEEAVAAFWAGRNGTRSTGIS